MKEEMEQVYIKHRDRVQRFIFLMVRHHETAEDLTQETFYRAWRQYSSYTETAPVAAWLIKIARNVTYDFFRRKKTIQWSSWDGEYEPDPMSQVHSAEEEVEKKEEMAALYAAISRLKPDYQDVLLLRKVNEQSIKDTAYVLGWSEAKVKMKMARAMEQLKREWKKAESPDDAGGNDR